MQAQLPMRASALHLSGLLLQIPGVLRDEPSVDINGSKMLVVQNMIGLARSCSVSYSPS